MNRRCPYCNGRGRIHTHKGWIRCGVCTPRMTDKMHAINRALHTPLDRQLAFDDLMASDAYLPDQTDNH